jgi:hypothetical protein
MAKRTAQSDPALEISFFLSGFYTYRSPLFAPYKGVGVNVVSFHDPVIDGNNMEDTDRYEWQRRPGYSKFCSVALADHEIVNEFYSARLLTGTVVPFVDTTARLATFSPTSLTTILTKTTTSQGYPLTIGQKTYFSDGVAADLLKWDSTNVSAWGLAAPTTIPVSSGMGFWQPKTHFNLGNSIQDTNGNIESVSAILTPSGSTGSPTTFDNLALAGGFGSWAGLVGPGGTVSETLTSIGHTNYLFFHDFNLAIPSGSTILGIVATIPKKVQGGVAVDQSMKLVIGGVATGTDHASVALWSNAGFVTSTYGSPIDTWGASPTAAQLNANGLSGFGVAIAANVTSTTAYALVQTGANASYGAPTTISSFANPVTAGNTLVVGVMTFNESFVSISDTQNNPYVLIATETFGLHTLYVYVSDAADAGSTSVTVTVNNIQGNSFTSVNIHEFSGIRQPNPVERTGANNSSPSSATSPFNSGTITTTQGSDLLFSYIYADGGGITSQPVGWTLAESNSLPPAFGDAYQQWASAYNVPGTAGTFSPSWARGTMGITVAFQSALSTTVTVGGGAPVAPVVRVYYQLPTGSGPGFSGQIEPLWSTSIGGVVNDAGLAWTNYGPIETWLPVTNYPVPVVVLDSNGFLQLAVQVSNPVQPWNSGTSYSVGQTVSFGGAFWIAVAANTNVPPTQYFTTNTAVGSVTTVQPTWAVAQNPSVTGAIPPVWNTTIGGTTIDGNYTWTNIGQGSLLETIGTSYVYAYRTIYGHLTTASEASNNTGAILGPLNGSISSFSIVSGVPSNIVTFFGSDNFIVGNIFTVTGLISTPGTALNNQVFTVTSAVDSEQFHATATSVSANVLTVYALNDLGSAGGQSITFSSFTDPSSTWLNGLTVTVLPGATSTSFTASVVHSNYVKTATTGLVVLNGQWTAATTVGPTGGPVADVGSALPLISQVTGIGTASPLCNSVANITAVSVMSNIVTIIASNNFQPGIFVTLAGLSTTAFNILNNQQLQVIAVDQMVGTQNTQFQVFFEIPNTGVTPETGTATFNAVEIYRVSDGGGLYLFAGAVTNPGANLPWIFYDFVPDIDLNELLIAPLGHLNDPPPGAPGSTITNQVGTGTAYWNGRVWMIVGNYVYFSAGPDCQNGIPEEAWPPANRFQFAGPPLNLTVSPDGLGLLVNLADRVNVILGGPETISFYPTDFLTNFGISNPGAIYRDGSNLGYFTTQKQVVELLGKEKQQTGEHIADYLAANFAPTTSRVTLHRNGIDTGIFVSNGVDRILRFGTNIGAWSVPAFPSFGAGAVRSIETSVGITTLMAASPTGAHTPGNYLYARDLNSWGDGGTYGANNGTAYSLCNITIGSITLAPLGGEAFSLQHVVGYFDAAGTLDNGGPSKPDIWIMPNEISTNAGIGFVYLPEILQEPPIGQNQPSKSLLALRWPVNMMNSSLASQLLHTLQVKIQFEPENAPNTVKAIAFKNSQLE